MLVFRGVHPCFFFRRKCLFRGCKGKISRGILTEAGLIEELFLECKASLMYRKILLILNLSKFYFQFGFISQIYRISICVHFNFSHQDV